MITKTRIIPVSGIGARLIPTYFAGASPSEESPAVIPFDLTQATFLAAMAKRNSAGPFAAGVVSQGKRTGISTNSGDIISLSRGTQVAGTTFYSNLDTNQGTIVFWITPEWNGSDTNKEFGIFCVNAEANDRAIEIEKVGTNLRILSRDSAGNYQTSLVASIAGWVAGTTYCVAARWDTKNYLDGSNKGCISLNDVHTFGMTTHAGARPPDLTMSIGSRATVETGECLIEGLTIYRRPLWDGAYGVNVGNGDEINLIYAAGAGADPCTITGSWDVCLCVPTNSTVGALATGTGEAWSHPHSSNLLTAGWMQDNYYGNQWGVKFNGTSTVIDCGSGATLDDLCAGGATMQVEGWFRSDASHIGHIISKAPNRSASPGWAIYTHTAAFCYLVVRLATTSVTCFAGTSSMIGDGKWHHFCASYNDTTKSGQLAIDGIWGTANVGAGAYSSDAAYNLVMGRSGTGATEYLNGAIGWINVYNNAFYTPGTNFVPPRTPTAADVEQWLLNEGTGATATAQVTAPGNNGTITNGTWQPQWYDEGTRVATRSVKFGGTTNDTINCQSDAGVDDLPDNAFTIEGWVLYSKTSTGTIMIADKSNAFSVGWSLFYNSNDGLYGFVKCATTDANATFSTPKIRDGRWHHIAMTWDDAGDRKVRIWLDGVLQVTSGAGVGAIVSDAAQNLRLGSSSAGNTANLTGNMGWMRVSNSVRYAAGFTPASRANPPAVDGNTIAQWNMTEGAGTTVDNAEGTAGRDGTLGSGCSWLNTPGMDYDSPGARIYGWGYNIMTDAVNEGIKQTWTGLTAGSNYVLRASAYSEDGIGIPKVIIYDETNAAQITAITGVVTSTEWSPDHFIISFELPTNARGAAADCTSISIKLISTTAGAVGWHQCEIYANLLDNPSLDTGAVADPWIPYGWTNNGLDAGDSEIEAVIRHSEGASFQANVGASNEQIQYAITVAAAKFVGFGFWSYNAGAGDLSAVWRFVNGAAGGVLQYSTGEYNYYGTPAVTTWTKYNAVGRVIGANPEIGCRWAAAAGNTRYTDDWWIIALDDVTLTVTPASVANSLEGTGIRADGYDLLSQPDTAAAFAANWWYSEFFITPRHNDATVALFGIATPCWVEFRYNAANTIVLDWSAANTLRLRVVSGGVTYTGTWATGGGAIVAGTKYTIKIECYYGNYTVSVNGVPRIVVAGVPAFAFAPNIMYWGMDNARLYNSDIVISAS